MTTQTRRALQAAVLGLGAFFLVANIVRDGVTVWDFTPVVGAALGLIAIEQVRRNQERGL